VPVVTLYTITGVVTVGISTTPIAGATVSIVDGPNAGKTTITDGNGRYTLAEVTFAGFSVLVTAPGYNGTSRGVPLTSGVTPATANFSLVPSVAWSRTGAGDTVFDMPNYFPRVRVIGIYNGFSSNFIVRLSGRLLVNELLGTFWTMPRYEGVLLTNGGGVVEIVSSSGVSWSFAEER
jgi:hypothetical protein